MKTGKFSPKERDQLMWLHMHGLNLEHIAMELDRQVPEVLDAKTRILRGEMWYEPKWEAYMEQRSWTSREDSVLREMLRFRRKWRDIAAMLARTPASCSRRVGELKDIENFLLNLGPNEKT